MPISPEFETLILCRPILDLRFAGGWDRWIKHFSMEDDGELSRISAMSGQDIAKTERKIQKLGLMGPKVLRGEYQYTDYYIYAFEYQPHLKQGLEARMPVWLDFQNPKIIEIGVSGIENLPPHEQGRAFKPKFFLKEESVFK